MQTLDHPSALELLIPAPRLLEVDHIDIRAQPAEVWQLVRHGNLARTNLIRWLFSLRAIPDRLAGRPIADGSIHLDSMVSTPERPGFQILSSDAPHEVAIGAIGKVWQPEIPFVHINGMGEYAAFAQPGFIKVAWALRVESLEEFSRLSVEVRVDATNLESWTKFERYFLVIGPASRFIRRAALASIANELGAGADDTQRTLPGDELVPDATAQVSQDITIEAPASRIWPWLVQMGCDRAGFYSYDWLDNGGARSAREAHPEWQDLKLGDRIAATRDGQGSFEVVRLDPQRVLSVGGLFDPQSGTRLPFLAARPERYWHVSWTFVLEPITANATRLSVRARAAFSSDQTWHAAYIRPVHHIMERAQLRHLRARVEGKFARDDARDVLDGLSGAARMCLALASPFLRTARSHWGLDAADADRKFPGDELVPDPSWGWTHAVEISAPRETVWPWVAQIGATRGGFYSYQWLENLVGCEVHNAETVHPAWAAKLGDEFYLHPKAPALKVAAAEPGRWFVAYGPADESARREGKPWVAASWLFIVETLSDQRCRFVSRYRVAYSEHLATRLSFGPLLLEPIGFTMDRRMLLGVKARSER